MNSFTKGPWSQSHRKQLDGMYITQVYDSIGESICDLSWHAVNEGNGVTSTDRGANAHLIAAAPDMYAMIESLSNELNMAIDEVNTMRDIHHTDNLTPADHWDKESLHDAQVLLAKARGD